MQLEQLQLDLRPRPHWQALDLGHALLHQHAGICYGAWWALWGPLTLLLAGLQALLPGGWDWLPVALLWGMKPLVERIIVLILSRAVFGEQLSCTAALRAWPGQLAGGWLRSLSWWRLLVPGRALYQPIWQLEGARGAIAAQRRRDLGQGGARHAVAWFAILCYHLECVLYLALLALIGLFLSTPEAANPFAFFTLLMQSNPHEPWLQTLSLFCYAVSAGVIGPVYAAAGFTLYLNRRAELEAWDIELSLRRLAKRCQPESALLKGMAAGCLVLLLAGLPPPAQASGPCPPPEALRTLQQARGPALDAEQAALRARIDALYASDTFRAYDCTATLQLKPAYRQAESAPSPSTLSAYAKQLQWLLILAASALLLWLLYRFRGPLGRVMPRKPAPTMQPPPQIAGLDIRPETLPDDVAAAVRQLWQQGQPRAALALLYRATLSALVHRYAVPLPQGATEGDCLRLCRSAWRRQALSEAQYRLVMTVTQTWQAAAYAERWPTPALIEHLCTAWPATLHRTESPQ